MLEYLKIYLENDIEEHKLKKLKELGIRFPLYSNCYRKALTTILQYIDYNQEKNKEIENTTYYSQGFGNRKYPSRQYQTYNYIQYPDNSNIIAFIGKRGSGKTTALREFCYILSNYCNTLEQWKEELPYQSVFSKKPSFHVLSPIDASVLDRGEDLLELIWAEMYRIFKDTIEISKGFQNEEDIKRIIREFDEVYQNYHSINHNEHTEILGESVLVKLKNISSSQKARETFGKLVADFLNIVSDKQDSYLVITLDDIDVNLDKGYEMLEQIHKYLCDSRVIVLTAIDFEQMSMICEKQFATSLTIRSHDKGLENDRREVIKKACKDYLLKILPLENRIYQPSEDTITKEVFVHKANWNDDTFVKKEQLMRTKEYILWKIAKKTGIYYDSQGIKKHFCIPATVRALITYDKFLDSMFVLEDCRNIISSQKMDLFKRNYNWFHQDIVERMAGELLSSDQLKLFHLILDRHIERRAEYAVVFIRNWVKNERKIGEERLIDSIDGINYNYADLLEQIYKLGRDNYIDKVLVHCLLASFTSEMVREYYIYKHSDNEELRKEACFKLLKFRGATFGGSWFQNMSNSSSDKSIEYMERCNLKGLTIQCKGSIEKSKHLEELGKLVPCMECLSVFFSSFRDEIGSDVTYPWKCEVKLDKTEEGITLEVIIKSGAKSANFDIFGFIGKEMEKDNDINYKEMVIKSLKDSIEKMEKNNYFSTPKKEREFKEKLIQKVEESSIWNVKSGWTDEEVSFPYYNLDLSYNVMKRVKREAKDTLTLDETKPFEYFKGIYNLVIEKLEAQDTFYSENQKVETSVTKFAETFKKNPIVCAFVENKLDANKFNSVFRDMLKTVFVVSADDLEMDD